MENLSFNGFTVEFNAKAQKALATVAAEAGFASPDAFFYLVDYGFRQALSDKIAGMGKKLRDEGQTAEDIEAALKAAMAERHAAILAGEVGSRSSGPRLKPLDRIAFDEGVEQLKVLYRKASKKFPSGKGSAEAIAEGVKALWERAPAVKAKAYAEAEARLASQGDIGVSLEDLGI